jgi:uncharacterized protein
MRSAIYTGVVTHRRHPSAATADVTHSFDHRLTMAYLFLDELDEFFAQHPLWSQHHPSPVRFRRRDYLGDPALPLDVAVRDVAQERLGWRPEGPIAMLGQLRTWGWLFNPLTLYYCFDHSGTAIEAVVLEVTSTPWHERHVYVVDAREDSHRFPKEMHVSPFMGMDHDYAMKWSTPDERLMVYLGNRHGDEHLFDAVLTLQRSGSSRGELSRMVWRGALQTYGVSADIYRQAWRLFRKGAKFHPRGTLVASRETASLALPSTRD